MGPLIREESRQVKSACTRQRGKIQSTVEERAGEMRASGRTGRETKEGERGHGDGSRTQRRRGTRSSYMSQKLLLPRKREGKEPSEDELRGTAIVHGKSTGVVDVDWKRFNIYRKKGGRR